MSTSERVATWIRLTGLKPPDQRGFVPRRDPEPGYYEHQLTIRQRLKLKRDQEFFIARARARAQSPPPPPPEKVRGFMPKWSLTDASWRNNNDPGFDNVIRAYEEDR